MDDFKLGVLLWSQGSTWPEFERAAKKVDDLGYEHLWTWDHLHAIFGEPQQPIFEGWMSLAAWAKSTSRVRLGLLVGANTFRNPGLVAKLATTLDHISEAAPSWAWAVPGSTTSTSATASILATAPGERLDWMDEAAAAIRTLLDGGEVTSPAGGRYQFDHLRQEPLPIQQHLPLMIGGSGERKTLRTIAKYADMWNGMGKVDRMQHKMEVLLGHCQDVGRDVERDRQDHGSEAGHPQLRGRGGGRHARADGAQPDAVERDRRTTSRSSTDRLSSSPNI